jgi:hypothetical protein
VRQPSPAVALLLPVPFLVDVILVITIVIVTIETEKLATVVCISVVHRLQPCLQSTIIADKT